MLRMYLYLILAASVSALATDMIVPALPILQTAFNTGYRDWFRQDAWREHLIAGDAVSCGRRFN